MSKTKFATHFVESTAVLMTMIVKQILIVIYAITNNHLNQINCDSRFGYRTSKKMKSTNRVFLCVFQILHRDDDWIKLTSFEL